MKAIEIKKGIYWVGAIDWNVRNFHGYLTQKGTTYNAYLIIDEKITLVDTVKPGFESEMFERISSVIDPSKIDYVVCNHVEMDHSGALPAVMEKAPNAEILTCLKGSQGLKEHYYGDWKFKEYKSGEGISLGERSLQFVLTPMVHWPDNMVAYMPEEKLVFSNDAFGQHYATSERFADECNTGIVFEEAKKYYANIVLPYGNQVKNVLKTVGGLDIEMIAPSHGLIWRESIGQIVEKYDQWSGNGTVKKCIVVFDSMWKSTEKMAYRIQSAFEQKGYSTLLLNLQTNHVSDIMTELIDAECICVGSPTLNSSMMPNVAAFLAYVRGLAPKNRKAIAFGSYGWNNKATELIEERLTAAGFDVLKNIKHKYVPNDERLNEIEQEVLELL